VTEDDFPQINSADVWPTGCLIAPYYGKLMPDQIFTPSTPETGTPVASIITAADPAVNDGANGGSLTRRYGGNHTAGNTGRRTDLWQRRLPSDTEV
jgi:hypothetical protein